LKPIEYDSDGNPILSDAEEKKSDNSDSSDSSAESDSSDEAEKVPILNVGGNDSEPVEKSSAPTLTTSNPNRDQKKNLKLSDLSKTLANTNLDQDDSGAMSRKER